MDALLPTFIAALIALIGDGAPWLTAILADRYRRPLLTALAATIAHGAGIALAVTGALIMHALLSPNAALLLVTLALLFAGGACIFPLRAPERLDHWPLGPVFTPLIGIFILALGDSTQFFAFAFAARSPTPIFAGVGALLAATAVSFAAAFLGEDAWRALPLRVARLVAAALFLLVGMGTGLSALRLI